MDARLVAIAGPLSGSTFPLGGEVTIGRDASNAIAVSDLALSRKHCALKPSGGGWLVQDLDSRNGTLVNGVPVRERELGPGDQLQAGDSLFVFVSTGAERTPGRSELVDTPGPPASTIQLAPRESLFLDPERLSAQLAVNERRSRELSLLLRASRELAAARSAAELGRALFALAAEVLPAELGALALAGEPDEPMGFTRGGGSPVAVSRSLVQRVLDEGVALLVPDALTSEVAGRSVREAGPRSVLAVPLSASGTVNGAFVLHSAEGSRFDAAHLELATALAAIAGASLATVRHLEWLSGEKLRLEDELALEHELVGASPKLQEVLQALAKLARSDTTVLLHGESGTGKELAARALHRSSPRRNGPFVAVNCAALTETLLESELFGHEEGAFTGAVARKKGRLEAANGGTVFLDEVGELPLMLQAKLLRVLQEREVERVGGTKPIALDVRLVAATNRDLAEAVRAGRFRQDLYYRLNVVTLTMPPLRQRREDIPMLATYFLSIYGKKLNRKVRGVTPEARALLLAHDWPGNVRELANAIERAVVLGSSERIAVEDLPEALSERGGTWPSTPAGYHEALRETKRRIVLEALDAAGGNVTEAARRLGVHPTYLHRLMNSLDLREL